MAEQKKDYIKVTSMTRPICGNYELSAVLTKFAREIHDQKTLEEYGINEDLNAFINPTQVALENLLTKNYDAYLKRDNDVHKFSEMYVQQTGIEIVQSHCDRQQKVTQDCIIKRIHESTKEADMFEDDYEIDEDIEIEKVIQFDDVNPNLEIDIDEDDIMESEDDEDFDEDD